MGCNTSHWGTCMDGCLVGHVPVHSLHNLLIDDWLHHLDLWDLNNSLLDLSLHHWLMSHNFLCDDLWHVTVHSLDLGLWDLNNTLHSLCLCNLNDTLLHLSLDN